MVRDLIYLSVRMVCCRWRQEAGKGVCNATGSSS